MNRIQWKHLLVYVVMVSNCICIQYKMCNVSHTFNLIPNNEQIYVYVSRYMLAAYSKILKCVSFSIYCFFFFFATLIPNANNIELRRAVNLSLLHTSKYASIHFIWTEECPFWNALLANVIPFFELLCVFFSYIFFWLCVFSLVCLYGKQYFSYVCRERDNEKQKRI